MGIARIGATIQARKLRNWLLGKEKKVKEVKTHDRKFIGTVSAIVFKDVMDHFEKEAGPNGRWDSWSNSYQKKMDRRGFGGNLILQFNGRLRNSFQPTNFRKAPDGIVWFNPAKTKSGFPYAFHHDEGRSSRNGPRQFMWLSDKAMDHIGKATLGHIMKEV